MNKQTVALMALFAGWILMADIADATTYEDIAGQWCGDVTDYVFTPNTLTVKFHDDRPANVFTITKYTYTNDTVRIDWLNADGKESVTIFGEFSGKAMPSRRTTTNRPTVPSLLRLYHNMGARKMTDSGGLSWEAQEVLQKIKSFNRLPGAGIPLIQLNMRVGSAKTVKKGIPEFKSAGLITDTASGEPTLTDKGYKTPV